MNKTAFSSLKKLFSSLSSLSLTLLHIGLPIVLLYMAVLLYLALSSHLPSNVLAHIYAPSLEHIVMALTITVVGSLVADIAARHRKSR